MHFSTHMWKAKCILRSRKLESEQQQRKHQKKREWVRERLRLTQQQKKKRTYINSTEYHLSNTMKNFGVLCYIYFVLLSSRISASRYSSFTSTRYDKTEPSQTKPRVPVTFLLLLMVMVMVWCWTVALWLLLTMLSCNVRRAYFFLTLSTLKYQFLVCVLPILIFLAYSLISHHYLYFPLSAILHSIFAQFFSSSWVCTMDNFFFKKKRNICAPK